MKPITLALILLFALLLSACGGTLEVAFEGTPQPEPQEQATIQALETQIATLQPEDRPLDMTSSPEDVRRALLESHKNWQTLWVDAQSAAQAPGADAPTVERIQLWADRITSQYRVLRGPRDENPRYVEISDGTNKEVIYTPEWQITAGQLAEAARSPLWTAPRDPNIVTMHPLDAEIESIISELVFPAALGQRSGSYTPMNMDSVAGRPALVVEYRYESEPTELLWLDTRTGLVLRRQSMPKGAGDTSDNQGPTTDLIINHIAIDITLPHSLFGLAVQEPPRYALDASGTPASVNEPTTAEFQPGEGELYFVIDRTPEDLMLTRLPEACVTGEAACPEPQPIVGYPNRNNTIEPLIWAPDHTTAVLVHQGTLFHYHALRDEWRPLAQFPIIENPRWSRDGQQVVFTAQDDTDRQSLYVVRADGSGLTNLTDQTGDTFTGEPARLWAIGWLEDGRILYQAILRTTATLYAQHADGSGFTRLTAPAYQHGTFELAPDGRTLLIATLENDSSTLAAAEISGDTAGEARQLGSFQKASIQQMLWSPDGARVAFMVLSSSGSIESMTTTVYTLRADGSDLRQVFQETSILRVTFTSSGAHLIAEGTDNGRLTIIPLEGGAPRLLEAPGLRLDQRLLGASWR